MTEPPFLSVLAGNGPYSVRLSHEWGGRWYNLWREGDVFPLAGGPIDYIMKVYSRI